MKFLVQIVNGMPRLDLCQAMDKAKEYYEWAGNAFDEYAYVDINDLSENICREDICPVGTLEFVFKYIDVLYGNNAHLKIKPLNIPVWAEKFTYGKVYHIGENVNEWIENNITANGKWFMKSSEFFKDPDNGFINDFKDIKPYTVLTEAIPDILSEWRIFIYKGKPIDIKNYSGDPFIFPDKDDIDKICLENKTVQYGTIDIAVANSKSYIETAKNNSYVIECHDFFSCGLYGFDNPKEMALMLWRTWVQLKNIIN